MRGNPLDPLKISGQYHCFEEHHFGILETKFNQSRSVKYCPKLHYLQILNLEINESRLSPAWAFSVTPDIPTQPKYNNTIRFKIKYNTFFMRVNRIYWEKCRHM